MSIRDFGAVQKYMVHGHGGHIDGSHSVVRFVENPLISHSLSCLGQYGNNVRPLCGYENQNMLTAYKTPAAVLG